jgi:hypothetical protein
LRFFLEKRTLGDKEYTRKIKYAISNNAGFFPVDDSALDTFSRMYLDNMKNADVMETYLFQFEDVIFNHYCPDAELIHPTCLEPFWYTNPWSSRLAGKKVLVIYPFAESIQKQYAEKRQILFASPDILPEFDLKTLKTVQSAAGTKVDYSTWFDAYRYKPLKGRPDDVATIPEVQDSDALKSALVKINNMCDKIINTDFDICLIGAGAYGLPLASFAKNLGKQAVHMGGVTQILFGIKGKRWEELYADTIALLFNEHWVRPMESETPVNKDRVENGCYW